MIRTRSQELSVWIVAFLPLVFLTLCWTTIPQTITIHYNMAFEPDRWGSKQTLIWLSCLPLLVSFGLILVKQTTRASFLLKLTAVGILSLLMMFIIYNSNQNGSKNIHFIHVILGVFFIILGQIMNSIEQNQFIGIRTRWTLAHKKVWEETHEFSSKVFLVSGLTIVITSVVLPARIVTPVFLIIILITALITVIYSYFAHKRYGHTNQND